MSSSPGVSSGSDDDEESERWGESEPEEEEEESTTDNDEKKKGTTGRKGFLDDEAHEDMEADDGEKKPGGSRDDDDGDDEEEEDPDLVRKRMAELDALAAVEKQIYELSGDQKRDQEEFQSRRDETFASFRFPVLGGIRDTRHHNDGAVGAVLLFAIMGVLDGRAATTMQGLKETMMLTVDDAIAKGITVALGSIVTAWTLATELVVERVDVADTGAVSFASASDVRRNLRTFEAGVEALQEAIIAAIPSSMQSVELTTNGTNVRRVACLCTDATPGQMLRTTADIINRSGDSADVDVDVRRLAVLLPRLLAFTRGARFRTARDDFTPEEINQLQNLDGTCAWISSMVPEGGEEEEAAGVVVSACLRSIDADDEEEMPLVARLAHLFEVATPPCEQHMQTLVRANALRGLTPGPHCRLLPAMWRMAADPSMRITTDAMRQAEGEAPSPSASTAVTTDTFTPEEIKAAQARVRSPPGQFSADPFDAKSAAGAAWREAFNDVNAIAGFVLPAAPDADPGVAALWPLIRDDDARAETRDRFEHDEEYRATLQTTVDYLLAILLVGLVERDFVAGIQALQLATRTADDDDEDHGDATIDACAMQLLEAGHGLVLGVMRDCSRPLLRMRQDYHHVHPVVATHERRAAGRPDRHRAPTGNNDDDPFEWAVAIAATIEAGDTGIDPDAERAKPCVRACIKYRNRFRRHAVVVAETAEEEATLGSGGGDQPAAEIRATLVALAVRFYHDHIEAMDRTPGDARAAMTEVITKMYFTMHLFWHSHETSPIVHDSIAEARRDKARARRRKMKRKRGPNPMPADAEDEDSKPPRQKTIESFFQKAPPSTHT